MSLKISMLLIFTSLLQLELTIPSKTVHWLTITNKVSCNEHSLLINQQKKFFSVKNLCHMHQCLKRFLNQENPGSSIIPDVVQC